MAEDFKARALQTAGIIGDVFDREWSEQTKTWPKEGLPADAMIARVAASLSIAVAEAIELRLAEVAGAMDGGSF